MARENRREFLKRSAAAVGTVAGVLGGWRALGAAESKSEGRPNIVMVLADDLGIECLSTYGGTGHETPNLDKLAAQGMKFTRVFSNPYCSPSRASLLTGRYPFKHGLDIVIYDRKRHANKYLKTDQPSFARQLKQAGYATAIAGKWQLSFLHKRDEIRDFGFDEYQCWQIFKDSGAKTRRFHKPYLNRNGTIIADKIKDRYGPDVNVESLIDFIKTNVRKKRPFMAYYTCLLPHFPWVPTPDSKDQTDPLKKATDLGDKKFFPDMVKYLDKNVGRLMQALDDQGVADNTVLIFVSDNGTDVRLHNSWGKDKSIRGGKGTMTDRGTHVPLLVRWPGRIAKNSTNDDLIDFSDICPTLCELTGAAPPKQNIHGRSFVHQLLGKPGRPRAWVHAQMARARHLRNEGYILNNKNQLRPVVKIWEPPAKPVKGKDSKKEQAARKALQAGFDELRQ